MHALPRQAGRVTRSARPGHSDRSADAGSLRLALANERASDGVGMERSHDGSRFAANVAGVRSEDAVGIVMFATA